MCRPIVFISSILDNFTEDIIHASIGFRCADTLKSHLQHLYQDTVHLDSLPADSVLDLGGLAMSKKTQKILLMFLDLQPLVK